MVKMRLSAFGAAVGIALAVAGGSGPSFSEEAKYIGGGKCKMCHIVQYKSWEKLKHAKTHDLLKGDDAKNAECLSCHDTGFGKPQAEGAKLENVQCEACHGPGSNYSKMDVMKDPAKAKEAGCVKPTEETCKKCHNEKSKFFKGFKFAEKVKEGVHEHKKK